MNSITDFKLKESWIESLSNRQSCSIYLKALNLISSLGCSWYTLVSRLTSDCGGLGSFLRDFIMLSRSLSFSDSYCHVVGSLEWMKLKMSFSR